MRWKRPFAVVLTFVLLTLVPGIAFSESINVTLSRGHTAPNLPFIKPNNDLAVVELPFDITRLLGYAYLEVKGNQSYNAPFIDINAFGEVQTGQLMNQTLMDAPGADASLSNIIESFVQDNFSSLSTRLQERIGKTRQMGIRWDRLKNVTFNVSNTPIYFSSKTVDSNGVTGRAVIKSLKVRFNAVGLSLGDPDSGAASSSIDLGPVFGTSGLQEFPEAKLRMVISATVDYIHANEEETRLYSPNFTLFTLSGLQADIAGQSFSTDAANKLDFVRPGEKVNLTASGSYITGGVDGGEVPPQAAARIPIPTLPFSFTFSNDSLYEGLNGNTMNFAAGAIKDGRFNTSAQDSFLVQIPTTVPLAKPDNPIKRGYTFMGTFINTRAFYNDYTEFPALKDGLVDKIKTEITPLAKAAYSDLTSINDDVLKRAYGSGYNTKFSNADAFASALANIIADKIIETLKSTYEDDQGTNQSHGSLSDNIATYMRILPSSAQEEYQILYTKYYTQYNQAKTDAEKQEAIKRFNAELDNLIARYYTSEYANKVWFSITNPLKGIGVRLKQDDMVSARGALIDGIPNMVFAQETESVSAKNGYVAYKLLNDNPPNLLSIALADINTPGILKPEMSWLDADYTQLVQYGKTYKGYISFTNYGDVPITNFVVRMYLFNAKTGQKLYEKPLGYVYGTKYTFDNPYKTVSVDTSYLRTTRELFGSIPPLKDMYGQLVDFVKPGKAVFVPIEFSIPTDDPMILITTAGASYKGVSLKSSHDKYYEYIFDVERKFYFNTQDQPSMFVGFAPNKIMTRETEAKYGGGLVAKFSIMNINDAETQRQLSLSRTYGTFSSNDIWQVPVNDLLKKISVHVLKPYDITVGGLDETTELKGGYWVPGEVTEIEWERTIWNIDPRR